MPRSQSPAVSLDRLAQLTQRELDALQVSYGQAIKHAIKAGELLAKAKGLCAHGEWLAWLKDNFDLSDRTAQRYMLIAAEAKENPTRVADLSVRAVRKGVALPPPAKPREPEIPADSDMGKLLAKAEQQRELPPPPPASEEEPIVDAEVIDDGEQVAPATDAPRGEVKVALELVERNPGITIPELAARIGCNQNRLYRVLPGLEQEGKIEKQGRGWHPKQDPAATPPAEDAPVPPAASTDTEPAAPAEPSAIARADFEPQPDPEIPTALTIAEERKFLAIVTQVKDAMNLLQEASEEGLSTEAVANALRDAGHASRRAAVNLEELASNVEKRA